MAAPDTRAEFNQLCHWLCWPVRWDWVCELRAHPGFFSEELERAFERYDDLLAVLPADFSENAEFYPTFLSEMDTGLRFLACAGGKRHDAAFWSEQHARFLDLWWDFDGEEDDEDRDGKHVQAANALKPAAGAAKPSEEHLG